MIKELTEIDNNILQHMKSLTLLCVEDDPTTQILYESIFENIVKKIIFAKDGEDGYEKYLANNIDLILTDYSMPKLNGLDMIKRIRISNKDIPIILVSAITDIDIIVKALQLHVNNFIKKPIVEKEVINALESVSKLVIANRYLEDQKNTKLQELEEKDKYSSYQEDLAFAKELNILRNDFYYQMIDTTCTALVDFSYQPLDILSGDAYSARRIDKHKTFYLIVDGMGKGLSASLSSMLVTSFINHIIDKMHYLDNFDLHRLIYESLEYIKPILLDEEALSIDYILLDCMNSKMQYAKFAMPAILLQNKDDEVIKIKSNNGPISKYMRDFTISNYDTSQINKFLFYSDGMVENPTRFKDKLYIDYIEEDFLDSFTKDGMRERLLWKIDKAEDDITFIFINKLDLVNTIIAEKSFDTNMEEIDNANEWNTNVWETLTDNVKMVYSAGIVFTELFMNAFEHGNLGLDSQTKHRLIEEDTYLETLQKQQENCNKQIHVIINKITYKDANYIITRIEDDGEGFDTQILSEIFRNAKSFNGRGVFVSRSSSLGIYYNTKGNSVLFLHKI
ncbi:response regulator [Sulfurimonas sp.]|uniref:response regulator n=1 Tax=Sulfurimonas sp. TaxID=2022749 RepID=UPI003567ED7D